MSLQGILFPMVSVIVFYLALIGNGIVVFKILRHKKMLIITNMYLLSLACANLLFIVTCLPFFSHGFTLNFWPWGAFLCKLSNTTYIIYENVSVFTLIALLVERYSALIKPIGILQSRSLTVCIVIIIWVVACILASFKAVYNNIYENESSPQCYTKIDLPFLEIYQKVYTAIQVVASILLLFVSITYILRGKKRSAAQSRTHDGQHLATAVMICAIVYCVCVAPRNVFWVMYYSKAEIIYHGDYYEKFWLPFIIIGSCLGMLQSCTMPIILYCMGGYNFGYLNYRPSLQTGNASGTEMVSVHLHEERL